MDTTSILNYRDFPYFGPQNHTTITVDQVVRNATKMILFSKLGDYGRNINKGGILVGTIGKSTDQITEDSLKRTIEDSISELANIRPTTIEVKFSREEKAWKIHVVFIDTLNKFVSSVDLELEG